MIIINILIYKATRYKIIRPKCTHDASCIYDYYWYVFGLHIFGVKWVANNNSL